MKKPKKKVASHLNDYTIEWTGNLRDDCVARWRGMLAHCEVMSDHWVREESGEKLPNSQHYVAEHWFFAVYVMGSNEAIYHSGEAGGGATTGNQARALCEIIMRQHDAITEQPPKSKHGARK